ncbi:MAG: diacylglycerol kinase family lipid kinase [Limnochordales bacterium]
MELALIVNPAAGGGRVRRRWPRLEQELRRRGVRWQAFWTEGAGHATVLAKAASQEGYDAVVAVGGDGTLNEVVNGAVGTGVPVGLIPLGTGIDFSRTAGLPRSPKDALDVILAGRVRHVDLGVVNDRYFCNVAGTGFDATVADRVNRFGSKSGGIVPYLKAVFQTLFTYRNTPFRISVDDRVFEVRSLLMAVANGRYYGGGFMICPDAELADGRFDVCIVGDIDKLSTVLLLPRVVKGGHRGHPKVTFVRGRRIKVEGPPELRIQADGELVGHLPAYFEIKQAALPMLLP